jgi:hypothetical protein
MNPAGLKTDVTEINRQANSGRQKTTTRVTSSDPPAGK